MLQCVHVHMYASIVIGTGAQVLVDDGSCFDTPSVSSVTHRTGTDERPLWPNSCHQFH